jgi:hypothetical protein
VKAVKFDYEKYVDAFAEELAREDSYDSYADNMRSADVRAGIYATRAFRCFTPSTIAEACGILDAQNEKLMDVASLIRGAR